MNKFILKHYFLALTIIACMFCFGCSLSLDTFMSLDESFNQIPSEMESEEVKFELPKAETWDLRNGLRVYYYFNDELPFMRGKLYFRGGALHDYSGHDRSGIPGLANAAGDLMREGSIKGIAPEVLDKRLDTIGASIESGFGQEFGTAAFSSLDEDFDEVFEIFSRIVKEPAFNRERFELWKRLQLDAIKRRQDSSGTLAGLSFRELIYGKDSPWSRFETTSSISKIKISDLRAFHQQFVRPDGAILTITGSLPKEKVIAAIEKYFGLWTHGIVDRPVLEEPKPQVQPGIYVLQKNFKQATVAIGHIGPQRNTSDFYDMTIFNDLYGHSGFNNRLFREIRTKKGLAYEVGGGLFSDVGAGLFQVVAQTRNEQVPEAIKTILEVTKESQAELFPEEDFNNSVSSVEKGFVFKFEEPSSVVDRAALLELLEYPKDYDEKYLENLRKVTPELVRDVANRWIRINDLVVVIVGSLSAEEIKKQFPDSKVYKLSFDEVPKVIQEVL